MPIDITAAERFVLASARLLDRRRWDLLVAGGPAEEVLTALRAYGNPDGGFGHALEPDVRGRESEPTAALHALEVLEEAGASGDPQVAGVAGWVATVADADGGVPFVVPTTAASPHAPWMAPSDGGSHLTFGIAAALHRAGLDCVWRTRATAWCWARLEGPEELTGYWMKFALAFLDAVPDAARADVALAGLAPRLDADGGLPVPGGTADERLRPLALSPQPGTRSRALFTAAQIEADLDRLEAEQQEDGGWAFDWLAWSPGQSVDWRGALTVQAVAQLRAHARAGD